MASGSFGAISEDELKAFMASHPRFEDAGVGIVARFARAAADLVFRRQPTGEAAGFSAIVLSDSVRVDAGRTGAENAPMLGNANDPVVGAVWIAQAELKSAARLVFSGSDAKDLFALLADSGLASKPVVLVDTRSIAWHARLYPEGIEDDDFWIAMDIAEGPISEAAIRETLDNFWRQCLRTPTLANTLEHRLWGDAGGGVPMPRPEQRVQARLRDTLVGAFTRRRIRSEVWTEEGRGDIFIIADTTAVSGTPAQSTDWVLELKALCDMTSTGNKIGDAEVRTKEAISKGVVQATSYRSAQNGVQAALCCYEMRSSDRDDASVFAHVANAAASQGVRLWRWVVFRSDNDARMKAHAMVSA